MTMLDRGIARARTLFENWIYPGTWRGRYLFNKQRSVLEPSRRTLVADLAARAIRLRHGRGWASQEPMVPDGDRDLRSRGYVSLGQLLSAEQCDEIARWLAGRPCRSPYHPELGDLHPEDAPMSCHVIEYRPDEILACPYLVDIANDPRILSMVEGFLGARPTISNLSLWWSLAGRAAPKEAQLFHRDVDDLRFCKLFVYLTDVDMEAGPHVFVRNSPQVDACMGLGRFADQDVEATFGRDAITYFCGDRGQSFIVNTFGVHKGLLPKNRNRLLFQVQYSLLPIFLYDYTPSSLPGPAFRHDRYVNRLYVRP